MLKITTEFSPMNESISRLKLLLKFTYFSYRAVMWFLVIVSLTLI